MSKKTGEPALTYAKMVDFIVSTSHFNKAWVDMGEAGVGSIKSAKRIHKLMLESEWHVKKLGENINDLTRDAAQFTDDMNASTDPDDIKPFEKYQTAIAGKLISIEISYLLMGMMIGIYTGLLRNKAIEDRKKEG